MVSRFGRIKLYFPLAEERNKWKMFSHTPLGPGPEESFFESRTQYYKLLFCCPPLLTNISEHDSFSRFYRLHHLLFFVLYHEC